MQKHRYNIFPEASSDDFDRLVTDIRANGYDRDLPIILYRGAILDGWNRWRACQQLGANPATKEFSGSDSEAIDYTLRTNKRRNLTSSQWAAIAVEAEDIMAAIAAEVERERREKQSENAVNRFTVKDKVASGNLLPQATKPAAKKKAGKPATRTAEKAAVAFNTNNRYVKEAKRMKEENPEAFEAVRKGAKTIAQVSKEVKAEKKAKERAEKIEAVAKMKKEPASKDSPLPSFVLADPPWRYENATPNRRIENHYETAEHGEIIAHKPETAGDCVLFLWATAPKLDDAMDVIKKWGFDYKTCAIWDKEKLGMGYWFRGEHELLLVGVKGNVSPPQQGDRVSSIFRETRTKHSKKPECVYEWIEQAFPEHVKLEMYCRTPRAGWLVWGNEV